MNCSEGGHTRWVPCTIRLRPTRNPGRAVYTPKARSACHWSYSRWQPPGISLARKNFTKGENNGMNTWDFANFKSGLTFVQEVGARCSSAADTDPTAKISDTGRYNSKPVGRPWRIPRGKGWLYENDRPTALSVRAHRPAGCSSGRSFGGSLGAANLRCRCSKL